MNHTHQRFDKVLAMLEHERELADANLKRLTAAAAYLRVLLPNSRRTLRRRCTPPPRGGTEEFGTSRSSDKSP